MRTATPSSPTTDPPSSGGACLRTLDLLVIHGSTVASSGNGHASDLGTLIRSLTSRGHRVFAMEGEGSRDHSRNGARRPHWRGAILYRSLDELQGRWSERVRQADAVIIASSVPEPVATGHWVNDVADGNTVFLDADTPLTLARLESGRACGIESALVPRYDVYLSSTGGPALRTLEERYRSPAARAFHRMVDTRRYRPRPSTERWHLAYLGSKDEDDWAGLERLLLEPARRASHLRACVAGNGHPVSAPWPANVEHIERIAPSDYPHFYNSQRFSLSVTDERGRRAGWSPGARLLESASCGIPTISDAWDGIDYFFFPDEEILLARGAEDVLRIIRDTPRSEARRIGQRARLRVLARHTGEHRTRELERHLTDARSRRRRADRPTGHDTAARTPRPAHRTA